MKTEMMPCKNCGKERHVSAYQKKLPTYTGLCQPCSRATKRGENSYNWKGGKWRTVDGYICTLVRDDDFYYPMRKHNGYVLEHRLVMAKHLGRCLQVFETVHHKNGIKDDNRLENLEMSTPSDHIREHNRGYKVGYRRGYSDGKEKKIRELLDKIATLEEGIE